MSDLFHEAVPDEFLLGVFCVMERASQHIYQVLTKRPERMRDWVRWRGRMQPRGMAPHIWLGVSVEDQKNKDRIETLRQVPAAIRFLSLEPLIEDIGELNLEGIHWVIAGGESGPGARPMYPAWARSVRDQCQAAGIPFFFKQWGSWSSGADAMRKVGKKAAGRLLDGREWNEFPSGLETKC